MSRFRVWAPAAQEVTLRYGQRQQPMTAEADGWWTADIPSAKAGGDYGFILDGQGPFPDPRSSWQPKGVHGLSRLVDHRDFGGRQQGSAPGLCL